MKTAIEWLDILIKCGVKPDTAAKWADAFSYVVVPEAFSKGASEIDDFVSEILHESSRLESMSENLNYSSVALTRLFGRRITEEQAQAYGRNAAHPANQVAIANTIYGGEWGRARLGNTQDGDGYNFRGSGPLQITGRANFTDLERVTGIPLTSHPEILRQPSADSLKICVAWWEGHVPDSVLGDDKAVRKAVNGGFLGLDDTTKLANLLRHLHQGDTV